MLNRKSMLMLMLLLVMGIALVTTGCGDKTVAEVNGFKITEKELDRRVDNYIKSIERQGFGSFLQGEEGKEMIARIREDMLEDMIAHRLLRQEAERLGVMPDKSAIAAEVEKVKAQLSKEQFQQVLKEYNWTEKDLENFFKEQLIEQAVFKEVTRNITASESEIAEFYQLHKDELTVVRSSHILVGTEEEALQILAELAAGADFGQLAEQKSLCPSGNAGGDLDFFARGVMDSDFERVAFSLGVGEVYSEPVATQFGYHIIKVTDRKDSLEALRADIEDMLTAEDKAVKFDEFMTELIANANIVKK